MLDLRTKNYSVKSKLLDVFGGGGAEAGFTLLCVYV